MPSFTDTEPPPPDKLPGTILHGWVTVQSSLRCVFCAHFPAMDCNVLCVCVCRMCAPGLYTLSPLCDDGVCLGGRFAWLSIPEGTVQCGALLYHRWQATVYVERWGSHSHTALLDPQHSLSARRWALLLRLSHPSHLPAQKHALLLGRNVYIGLNAMQTCGDTQTPQNLW